MGCGRTQGSCEGQTRSEEEAISKTPSATTSDAVWARNPVRSEDYGGAMPFPALALLPDALWHRLRRAALDLVLQRS